MTTTTRGYESVFGVLVLLLLVLVVGYSGAVYTCLVLMCIVDVG